MKNISLLIIILLISQELLSQLGPYTPTVQSPNVASLGVFGTYPVGHFTGTPDISIPLYTVKEGGIVVPINLSYHPASVKPNEHPGWAGLGWSVGTVGTITRVQNGYEDEITPSDGYRFYYKDYCNETVGSDWDSDAKLREYFTFEGNVVDAMADVFHFSFPGYSGSFFYVTGRGWTAICDQNIKVEPLPGEYFNGRDIASYLILSGEVPNNNVNGRHAEWKSKQSRMFAGFIITTEDGTKYYFGGYDAGNEQAVEYQTNYGRVEAVTASAWHLRKIEDVNKHVVEFKYKREKPICRLSFHSNIIAYDCAGEFTTWFGLGRTFDIINSGSSLQNINTHTHGGSLIFPVYLKEIVTSKETVEFSSSYASDKNYTDDYLNYYDDQKKFDPAYAVYLDEDFGVLKWMKLDEIKVLNKAGSVKKKCNFYYNNQSTIRLRLHLLIFAGADGTPHQEYSFTYNNFNLGEYGGNYTDHWGYYNGRNLDGKSFQSLPTQKNTNATLVKNGLLNKITYPAGGYTEFEWEAHEYSKYINSRGEIALSHDKAGGCRIKEIKSYANSTATPLIKTYYYLHGYRNGIDINNLQSSGILAGQPQYYFSISERGTTNTISYELGSVINLAQYGNAGQGSHIGYSEVAEVNSDVSYTIYKYTNYDTDDGHYDKEVGMIGWDKEQDNYVPRASVERERGRAKEVIQYKSNNLPVQKKEYTYNNYADRFNQYLKRIELRNAFGCNAYYSIIFAAGIKEYLYRYQLKKEETTTYHLNGGETKETVEYKEYNVLDQPSKIWKKQSNGNTMEIIYKYPGDYVIDNSAAIECEQTYLACKNEAGRLYGECMNECGGTSNNQCIGQCEGERSGRLYGCETAYTGCLSNSMLDNNSAAITELQQMNVLQPVIEEQTRIIYTDGSKKLLSGKLVKYKNQESNLVLPSEVMEIMEETPGSSLQESEITSQGDFAFHSSYEESVLIDKYDDYGNVLQLHKPEGVISSYVWGYEQNFPIAKIEGIAYDKLDEVPGLMNELNKLDDDGINLDAVNTTIRNLLPDCFVTTYTFDPVYGMTSQTDPGGSTTYYEYDDFGRLNRIKDKNHKIIKQFEYSFRVSGN